MRLKLTIISPKVFLGIVRTIRSSQTDSYLHLTPSNISFYRVNDLYSNSFLKIDFPDEYFFSHVQYHYISDNFTFKIESKHFLTIFDALSGFDKIMMKLTKVENRLCFIISGLDGMNIDNTAPKIIYTIPVLLCIENPLADLETLAEVHEANWSFSVANNAIIKRSLDNSKKSADQLYIGCKQGTENENIQGLSQGGDKTLILQSENLSIKSRNYFKENMEIEEETTDDNETNTQVNFNHDYFDTTGLVHVRSDLLSNGFDSIFLFSPKIKIFLFYFEGMFLTVNGISLNGVQMTCYIPTHIDYNEL
eukprot:GAHX01001591.1.p1 GENE.GAHX01001591.1~~GAHX01001591.1.p1  ORF type:complete len:307 (+),score=36.44 GAHX01001591.1:87-1007(+)